MNHLAVAPILLPVFTALLMLMPWTDKNLLVQRSLTLFSSAALIVISVALLLISRSETLIYVLGNWHPPFGIMLLVDPLSALMLVITAILAFCALLYSSVGEDKTGRFFYPLFMFLLMGVNGAFLTGDLFNLFVFFEILLIASYSLLIHGGGKAKTAAAVHYVFLNLIGSAIFLIALGTLYGTVGSLNMADMAARIPQLPEQTQFIVKVGGLLLLVVFGLKSAMLPLQFWLAKTYSAAAAPVAALFAIMTKVGIYSIYRVFGGLFGEDAGALAHMATPYIWPLAIATLLFATVGLLAAPSMRNLSANVVMVSVGTLLLMFVVNQGQTLTAAMYYMAHSTFVAGALFLIADQVSYQRGPAQDNFVIAKPMAQGPIMALLFFVVAIATVGLPPLSGFIGKALILQTAVDTVPRIWIWSTVLLSSFFALIAFSRAGTALFWFLSGNKPGKEKAHPVQLLAIVLLLLTTVAMSIFAQPIAEFAAQAGASVSNSNQLVQAVIADFKEVSYGY